jgi:glycosyltransferase involved in cell wall biosynthesis
MKIAMIVQRYGTDIVGGAESHSRGVAEGLAQRGHEVEVITTCARSYITWANAFPEGVETVNGLPVRRFRVEYERDIEAFNGRSDELFGQPHTIEDEEDWLEAQGPYCPGLIDHLHTVAGDFDRLFFFTYLYYPTVHGLHAAPEKSVLQPTAHDEAAIYLQLYDAVFSLPTGIFFNTDSEEAFLRRRFRALPTKTTVVGAGIDHLEELCAPSEGAAHARREGAATGGPPTVVYAGRLEAGKGIVQMLDFLRRYRRESGMPLRVELMGELLMDAPDDEWIEVLGFVSDEEKVRRLREATVLVSPAPLESLGLVVLEAMAAGTPPLVNADAEPVKEHCRRANSGLYYRDYPEFRQALELLLTDDRLRQAMAKSGASYVRENYSWPEVIRRYESFLEELPEDL